MKKFGVLLIFALVLGLAMPAVGAELKFHGDLNNQFTVLTDQAGLFNSPGEQDRKGAGDSDEAIKDGGVSDHWGDVKYRLWADAATNDGAVRGVVATEMSGLRYGSSTNGAMDFSGDGIVFKLRWAYTDFQLPFIESKSRLNMGLGPVNVNYYLWNENASGIQWYGSIDSIDYRVAWIRGFERVRDTDTGGQSVDSFFVKGGIKPLDGMNLNAFVMYTNSRGDTSGPGLIDDEDYLKKAFADEDLDLKVWELGIDGSYKTDAGGGNLFFKWDLIYQTGEIDDAEFAATNLDLNGAAAGITTGAQDYDVNAYFLHADAGFAWDDFKFTYTFWYASGDDDPRDDDLEGFFSTDQDTFTGSAVLMESYNDDGYFTERPYLLDKGFVMNKLAFDWMATDKLKVGAAVAYMLTAEDIEYTDTSGASQSEDEVGTEIMGFLSYKLYQNLTFSINAAYLLAEDAMDYWEEDSIRDGSSDEDIFRSQASVRYKF
jgi:hypothetical protein